MFQFKPVLEHSHAPCTALIPWRSEAECAACLHGLLAQGTGGQAPPETLSTVLLAKLYFLPACLSLTVPLPVPDTGCLRCHVSRQPHHLQRGLPQLSFAALCCNFLLLPHPPSLPNTDCLLSISYESATSAGASTACNVSCPDDPSRQCGEWQQAPMKRSPVKVQRPCASWSGRGLVPLVQVKDLRPLCKQRACAPCASNQGSPSGLP